MYVTYRLWRLAAVVAVLLAGCGKSETEKPAAKTLVDGSKYLLSAEPPDAQQVKEVLEHAKDEDSVVVVGRIGGEQNPWVEGLAAFNIADLSLTPCNERGHDGCATPWDYCCDSGVDHGYTLVTIVDEQGNVIQTGAKELLQLQELQTVVIQGKALRDDTGNLSLLATGIYVRP